MGATVAAFFCCYFKQGLGLEVVVHLLAPAFAMFWPRNIRACRVFFSLLLYGIRSSFSECTYMC